VENKKSVRKPIRSVFFVVQSESFRSIPAEPRNDLEILEACRGVGPFRRGNGLDVVRE